MEARLRLSTVEAADRKNATAVPPACVVWVACWAIVCSTVAGSTPACRWNERSIAWAWVLRGSWVMVVIAFSSSAPGVVGGALLMNALCGRPAITDTTRVGSGRI